MTTIKYWATAAAAAALLSAAAARAEPPPWLEQAFRQAAKEKILPKLHERKYCNVGVLLFRAARGDKDKMTASLGTVNRRLADQLEVALVLAQEDDDNLCVLLHASDTVVGTGNDRMNHLTKDGRDEFFPKDPPLFERPWGKSKKVPADAFLTGEARLADDLKTVVVTVQLFDREHHDDLEEVCKFPASIDWCLLADAGVSFVRRGFDDKDPNAGPQDVVKGETVPVYPRPDLSPKDQTELLKPILRDSPVRLTILYDGKEIPVENGEVRTPDPKEKVTFRLKNKDKNYTYGVVLKVNGENTIDRERLTSALDCYKWILEPGKEITLKGFQQDNKQAEEFKVVAPGAASDEANAINYDPNSLGMISLVVFREVVKNDKNDDALVKKENQLDVGARGTRALRRGKLDVLDGHQNDLKTLKGELERDSKAFADPEAKAGKRGYILPGEKISSEVKVVPFTAIPEPVASLEIRYATPAPK
jgi:hypothetical protein